MRDTNEFYLMSTDDGFMIENGQILGIESDDKTTTVKLLDKDINSQYSIFVLRDECDLDIHQEGSKLIIKCSNRDNFTWNKLYDGVED